MVQALYQRFLTGGVHGRLGPVDPAAGVLTHRGNPFDSRRVKYILTNPVYLGTLRWHPEGRGQGTPLEVEGAHPPLVSQETFQAAAERLAAYTHCTPRHARPWGGPKALAGRTGHLCCLWWDWCLCGPHYLRCGGYAKGRCTCSQHVRAEVLARAVMDRLRADSALAKGLSMCPVPTDRVRGTPGPCTREGRGGNENPTAASGLPLWGGEPGRVPSSQKGAGGPGSSAPTKTG